MADYREIFEELPDGVTLHDASDGSILETNQQFCEMLGYTREELLDLDFQALHVDEPPYTSDRAEEYLRKAATEGPQTFEWLDQTKDGEAVPVEVHLSLTTIAGEPRILAVVRDITARKQRERELEATLERMEFALDSTDSIIYEHDLDAGIQERHGPFDRLYGVASERVQTSEAFYSHCVHPDDRDRVESQLRSGQLTDVSDSFEYEFRTHPEHGDERWIASEVYIRRGTADDPERLVGLDTDITQRKERGEKITALHDVAQELVRCETPEAVYDRLVEAAEDVLDYDHALVDTRRGDVLVPEAVSGELSPNAYYDETPIDADDNLAARAYRSGESTIVKDVKPRATTTASPEYRALLTAPIGDFGVFQAASAEPGFFDSTDRELAGLLCDHARNALARIERRQELQRQNQRLEEFAGVVSHDLRNPLNVASGRLTLVRDECESEHLDPVVRAHERMEELIENVLSLASVGESIAETEAADLPTLVEDCWRTVETESASLVTDTDSVVHADETRLRQLLENLIRNAVQYGGNGTVIRVGDLADGFYVEDDGPGIPADEREHIFEAGYSTADNGTGFGLHIVLEIAEAHGWEVDLDESAEGGARFEFTAVQQA